MLPEYEYDIGEAGNRYVRDAGGDLSQLPAAFFWHELWERFSAVIRARSSRQVWRHKKRGTQYHVIGVAELQVATVKPSEGDRIVIYVGVDGKTWARAEREFLDGRFERDVATPWRLLHANTSVLGVDV